MLEVPAGHPEKPQGEDGLKLLERMNGGTHEELALWGLAFLPIDDVTRVLDIGCGGGANIARLLELAPQSKVSGVDYSPTSVQASRDYNKDALAEGRCEVLEGNASDLPFADNAFDVATAFETVYYWDLPAAFAEVRRVLKMGGYFLVCNEDNGLDEERLDLASRIPGMIMFTAEQLIDALKSAGFLIEASEAIPEKGYIAIVARKPSER